MNLHTKWPHRWITPKAVSRESHTHGWGVFAKEKINKGDQVAVFGGIVVPRDQVQEYWNLVAHIGIQISDDFFMVPTSREEVEQGGVFNHGCDPNCGFENTFIMKAITDIEIGEELLFDYAFCETFMDDFDCHCGAIQCRKKVTQNDWKLEKIQSKYLDYFSPYLKDKLRNI